MKNNSMSPIFVQLTLFGGAYVPEANLGFAQANEVATANGYVLHPELCHTEVLEWIKENRFNPNATFYRWWADLYKSNAQRIIDQLLHYATAYYGRALSVNTFVPNRYPVEVGIDTFRTLKVFSREALTEKVLKMAYSGIALESETVNRLVSLITTYGIEVDLDKIKNKELLMKFHEINKTVPTDATEFVRYLVYLSIGKTLLIKDPATLKELKQSSVDVGEQIERFGVERLAKVYRRHKKLLLCMKKGLGAPLINKVARLSKTANVPYAPAYVETILSDIGSLDKLDKALVSMTNFKKVSLLQAIAVRRTGSGIRAFVVRNGKLWIRPDNAAYETWHETVYNKVYASLVESLSKKACDVVMNKHIHLVLPTSEKTFVGNIPFGSYIDFTGMDGIIGINWREEDGAKDLDLSLVDYDGDKIGWNSDWNKDGVLFSGDMVEANPEATELMTSRKFPQGIIKVNQYYGKPNSKFKFFFANERIETMERNYMVDPNNIIFSTSLNMGANEVSLGVVQDHQFVFANVKTGSRIVSTGESVTGLFAKYWFDNSGSFVTLEQVLRDAGFNFVDKLQDGKTGMNFAELDRSTLISLMS